MIIPKLALRNLLGAGLKTWLNVVVLSFAFVAIIWTQGLYKGWDYQGSRAMIDVACGGGQYWMEKYDPFDPFSLQDAHAGVEGPLKTLVETGKATPVLVVQGTIYPNGRIQPTLLKGIDPEQKLLTIPSHVLKKSGPEIPALIGSRMAQNSGLKTGDMVTVRWRDTHGTFDARDLLIVQVMQTIVQSIDSGQVWIPLQELQQMADMDGEATIVVVEKNFGPAETLPGWTFKGLDFLLKDIREFIQAKSIGSTILYAILLFLAMLAIFNTQVLSIFRRRKEMGTLMAMGMSRGKVIQLFTLEGTLHSVLAGVVGAIYGIPLLVLFAVKGMSFPGMADQFGLVLGERIFPIYTAGLVAGTSLLVLIVTSIVSFLPTRKIARLKPTDALRDKTKW
ncbi:MAG: FtsX-like permease family protein [Candidatus Aminicenantales bacterium]